MLPKIVCIAVFLTTSIEVSIPAQRTLAPVASTWILSESKNKIDDTPEVILSKSSTDGGSDLVIRCAANRTEAYVVLDAVIDEYGVRTRFDQAPPEREIWNKATSY